MPIVSEDELNYLINVIEKLKLQYKVFYIQDVEAFIHSDIDSLFPPLGDTSVYVYVLPPGYKNISFPITEKDKLKKIEEKEVFL